MGNSLPRWWLLAYQSIEMSLSRIPVWTSELAVLLQIRLWQALCVLCPAVSLTDAQPTLQQLHAIFEVRQLLFCVNLQLQRDLILVLIKFSYLK